MADREVDAVLAALAPLGEKASGYFDPVRCEFDVRRIQEDAGAWSSGEKMMVEVAVALWRGIGTVDLPGILATFDDNYWQAFVDALAARRGREVQSTGAVSP